MDLLMLLLLPFMLPGLSQGQSGQFFLTPPSNTSVVEGETARILCQVGTSAGRAHGRVQWTKSGLTLGYDRALPGFPRYSMLGEDSEGRYDLQIVNATMEDNDDYECQVGPGGGSPPIRSSAKLDVLLAPTGIEIMNHASGSRIEIRENTEVELICTVRDSKPAASIVWYRKGQRFNPSGSQGSVEDKVEDGSPNRKTVTSKIKFRPNSDDNQASYACEAVHPALKAGPMRVSVFLSVLYPPEPPEIQGYIEGETIRMGQSVTLVCESCGGNPLASIVWYKNNERIDHSYTTSGSKSKNTYMFVAAPDDNNAVYRCEAKNLMIIEPLSAEIRMSVQFAPDKVTIEGPKVAKVNETLNFECTTANSNPASSITWVVDGRTYPATHTRNDTSKGGGWITTSNMSINISATDRNKAISCYSNNYALGETIVGTHIVNVLYPPDDLSITGYKEGDTLKEGSLQRIKCTVLSGNPLPKLSWHKGKKKINSEIQEGVSGTYRSAEMSITARRQDNGKIYECRAKNEASTKALVKNVTISVDFPPNFVNVTSDKDEPKEGELTTLTCITDSSKPAAVITWWHNGTKLNATDMEIKAGKFGGSKTTSMLQINVTVEHVDAIFRCEAKHKETGSSVHNAIKLKVHYKPQFVDVKDKYEVEVGGSKILTIKSKAHPSPTKWVWKKKKEGRDGWKNIQTMNQALPNTHIAEMPDGSLNMTNVQKEDAGVYKILITNSVATSQSTFNISILYPPSFMEISRSTLVNVGEDVILACNVDASPLKPNTIKWKRSKYDMSRVIKESTASGSKITIKNVTIEDAGMFTCTANNGIPKTNPETIEENLYLLVKHKPIIDKSKALKKAASDKGFDGKLICKAKGAPNITFKWFRNGERINGGPEESKKTKHVIRDEMEDYLNWKTELIVRRVDSSDYGAYECFAQNVMGDSRHEVVLDVKSRPDPPVGLQVQNVTYNSVYLTWEAGFDGGFPQMYRIRMLKEGADNFAYMDVFPTNATEFLLPDLQFGTMYSFNIMASNRLGSSNYTAEKVVATTLSQPPLGTRQRMINEVLEVKGDIPFIVIVCVSIAGILLLILNVILISCFIHKKRVKPQGIAELNVASSEAGGSSSGSTKSATIEMYVGSSYNETISGETLSSISEKSGSYMSNEHEALHRHDFSDELDGPALTRTAASTYLIDHNPIYSSGHHDQTMSSMYATLPRRPHPPTDYQDELRYQEDLRRQGYMHSLDGAGSYSDTEGVERSVPRHGFPQDEGRHLQSHDYLRQSFRPAPQVATGAPHYYQERHMGGLQERHMGGFPDDVPPPPAPPPESYQYQNQADIQPFQYQSDQPGTYSSQKNVAGPQFSTFGGARASFIHQQYEESMGALV